MKKIGFATNPNKMKHRNLRDKIVVFETYGGLNPRCACCGEAEESFLTLDHMLGGGNTERQKFFNNKYQAGHHTYRELRLRGFPSGYQVLCMNCNFGRRMNNGVCPHKEKPMGARERLGELEKLRADGGHNKKPENDLNAAIEIRRKRRHKKVVE